MTELITGLLGGMSARAISLLVLLLLKLNQGPGAGRASLLFRAAVLFTVSLLLFAIMAYVFIRFRWGNPLTFVLGMIVVDGLFLSYMLPKLRTE